MRYLFAPLRENKEHIVAYEKDRSVHYQIDTRKIMFRDERLSEAESWKRRKFDTLLILNTPQKRVTIEAL